MDIIIIGTGNTAHVLGRVIKNSPHKLLQVAGRDPVRTAKIGKVLDVSFASPINTLSKGAHLYIIAVSDDALISVGSWLQLDKKLVVHTAGSVPKEVLKPVTRNYGVLYPLQTLKADLETIPEIPFLIDGNTADDLALINDFASSLSGKVEVADDNTRLKLHTAAVIVNNFCNHLYVLAEKYCQKEKLSFELLQPLIIETANRISLMSPEDAQTGPAKRGDQSTIRKQLEVLDKHPELKRVYEMMSSSIEQLS